MLLSTGNRDEGQYGTQFFQGKLYNKNSADIVGKKKLLMLIKSNPTLVLDPILLQKMNIAYIHEPQIQNTPFIIHMFFFLKIGMIMAIRFKEIQKKRNVCGKNGIKDWQTRWKNEKLFNRRNFSFSHSIVQIGNRSSYTSRNRYTSTASIFRCFIV